MSEIIVAPPESEDAALLDVAARFLWNLPKGEPPTVSRLFFQLQQAHWYYEDFYVSEDGPCKHLPNYLFIKRMFETCPMLADYREKHDEFIAEFKQYVGKIPVYGAICLNASLDKVLAIRSWGGKSWSFPKGKVNEGEAGEAAAVREVWEEIGYDISDKINSKDVIAYKSGEQMTKLYIIRGVPDDGSVVFAPHCRKEVSEIGWFSVNALPTHTSSARSRQMFWSVLRVIPELLSWIQSQKALRSVKRNGTAVKKAKPKTILPRAPAGKLMSALEDAASDDGDALLAPLEAKKTDAKTGSAGGKWSVSDMFAANETITQRKYVYDGNPHTFGDYTRFSAMPADGGGTPTAVVPAAGAGKPSKSKPKSASNGGKSSAPTSLLTGTMKPIHPHGSVPVHPTVGGGGSVEPFRFDLSEIFAALKA